MLNSATPSEWARWLVRGAYHLHVHVEPDVMRRRVTDLQLARRCQDVGLAGFALKSHYVPTAERAAVLNEALSEEIGHGEVRVLGALTLNASVGGLNPIAVEIAAREGARILWMPTLDAANHRAKHADLPPDATPPMWLALQRDLADALRAAGFTDEEITTMIVSNSRLLAGPDQGDAGQRDGGQPDPGQQDAGQPDPGQPGDAA